MTAERFCYLFLWPILTYKYQQSHRRRPSGLNASNAVPLGNLGNAVVVVAAVLGLETAAMLATPSSVTLGTTAFRSANSGRSPRELAAESQTRLND